MKSLLLNPLKYDIRCEAADPEDDGPDTLDGYKLVTISLDSLDETVGLVNSKEAEKIGQWFLKLSKELKK